MSEPGGDLASPRLTHESSSGGFPLRMSHGQLLIATLLIAVGYAAFSLLSNGFYQYDEVGHYLGMRTFWHDPGSIIGFWPKPGYKLLFVIPALFGEGALVIANSLLAAFACYLTYRIADELEIKTPSLAFLLLATQPMWVQLSFRNYSETTAAVLLLLSLLLHFRDRPAIAALVLSYATIVRQELYLILAVYGLYLVARRRLGPALLLVTVPLLYNLWGWLETGNVLYLLTEIIPGTRSTQAVYPRQGFFHYPRMSLTIFGPVAVAYVIAYIGQWGICRHTDRRQLFVAVPLTVFVLAHGLFNLKGFLIGPSTGGNLRYMNVVAPLVAVLAAVAADRLPEMKRKVFLLVIIVPYVVVVWRLLSFEHNNLVLTAVPTAAPLVLTLLVTAGIFLPLGRIAQLGLVAGLSVAAGLATIVPYQATPEVALMKVVADWVGDNGMEENPILVSHTLFFYFRDTAPFEFEEGTGQITRTSVDTSAVGTVIVWDSRYSYRPKRGDDQLDIPYFLDRPDEFAILMGPAWTADEQFLVAVFQKKSETDAGGPSRQPR